MVNLQHNLTVDDLIVEYMIYKVNHGYEPKYLANEFMDFLKYFQTKMEVVDVLEDKAELFKRFMERKSQHEWQVFKNEFAPHMDIVYSNEDNDYKITANYRLSRFDTSVINTYFMSKEFQTKIRNIIGEYLKKMPLRKIDENINMTDSSLIMGKYIASQMLQNIWDSYINKLVKKSEWPVQCKDINKYLLEMDLAEIIGLKSIKKELLNFYKDISKRAAILYQQDNNLKISSCSGSYLADANYKFLIKGYEEIIHLYKGFLIIDLKKSTFIESKPIDRVYMLDEDIDYRTITNNIENDKVKKLVQNLETKLKLNIV